MLGGLVGGILNWFFDKRIYNYFKGIIRWCIILDINFILRYKKLFVFIEGLY